jgi:hypothetical protein
MLRSEEHGLTLYLMDLHLDWWGTSAHQCAEIHIEASLQIGIECRLAYAARIE